ncbi:MAG: hypothetical protein ACOYOA_09895 [Saprospiraceae bacterium]
MNRISKLIGPHLIATLIMVVFAIIYFLPAFQGKTLGQSDVIQAGGSQVEIKKFTASEGREMLWTNGMFAGMPTFQIYSTPGNNFNIIGDTMYRSLMMFQSVSNPLGLLFAAMMGMYLLLISLRIDWRISVAGAILYSLSTTHMILIEAGHVNKIVALALLPPTLAGILMIFRGKYLKGAALTAIFVCLQLIANHIQITYYFFILVAIYGIFALIEAIQNGTFTNFIKASAIAILAAVVGVLPNTSKLWTTLDYSSECIRGTSDLKAVEGGAEKPADGLTKDYAFGQWSFSKMESFTLLIPNFMGGDASQNFAVGEDGQLTKSDYKVLASVKDRDVQQSLVEAASHYWGEQSFVSGAWYWGAVLIFFFFLGFYTQKNIIRWWSLTAVVLILMISWGKNFAGLNYFLFDHFPMFNKFRDPKMIIAIGHIFMITFGFMGLQQFFGKELTKEEKNRSVILALSTVGGLIVFALLYGITASLVGPADAALESQYPDFIRTLRADRADLLTADAYRSLLYVLAVGGLLWASLKYNINKMAVCVAVLALAFMDIVGIDKRYLSNDEFQENRSVKAAVSPRPVDNQILADKELSFRVVDFSRGGNPFANALPSYFHKSMGGYHAAKLMIFQDVVDRYLLNPNESMSIYGMLNTKYIITPGENNQPQALQILEQCGNAWFVKSFKTVQNANEEMDALKTLSPKTEAVLQEKFAANIKDFQIQYDSTNTIKLEKYIPDHMTYSYKAKSDQLAMFSEVYYPEKKGWKVYIDGKVADGALMKANYLLRAVKVPQGEHTLEMKFEPTSYYTGLNIARIGSLLLALLFLGALFLYFRNPEEIEESISQQASLDFSTEAAETAKESSATHVRKKK